MEARTTGVCDITLSREKYIDKTWLERWRQGTFVDLHSHFDVC